MRKITDSEKSGGTTLTRWVSYAAWTSTYDWNPHLSLAVEEPWSTACWRRSFAGRDSTVTLIKHGHPVIGVGQSPQMLKLAATKASEAQFTVGDLTGRPIPDVSVNLALRQVHDAGRRLGNSDVCCDGTSG